MFPKTPEAERSKFTDGIEEKFRFYYERNIPYRNKKNNRMRVTLCMKVACGVDSYLSAQ